MTSKQKLLKLLKIATNNGWKDEHQLISFIEGYGAEIENNRVCGKTAYNDCEEHSLDELVTSFDKKSNGFILALFFENPSEAWEKLTNDDTNIYIEGMNCSDSIILSWVIQKQFDGNKYIYSTRPSSNRLNWLFRLFSHLLK